MIILPSRTTVPPPPVPEIVRREAYRKYVRDRERWKHIRDPRVERTLRLAATHVQSSAGNAFGASATVARTFSSNVSAGNGIIVLIHWVASGVTLTSVDDNAAGGSNTYTLVQNSIDPGQNLHVAGAYCESIVNGGGSAIQITAHFSGSADPRGIGIIEVGAGGGTLEFVGSAGRPQTNPSGTDAITTELGSGSMISTQDGAFIGATTRDEQVQGTITIGTGYTELTGLSASQGRWHFEYDEQTTAGTRHATFTGPGTGQFGTVGIMLQPQAVAQFPFFTNLGYQRL